MNGIDPPSENLRHEPWFRDKNITEKSIRYCTKCDAAHGMVVENMETGECEPIDTCYDCLISIRNIPPIPQKGIDKESYQDW